MRSARAPTPPPRGQRRLILVACILGSGIVFLDQTVVTVALPAIRDDLDAGLAAQQWVVDAYLLTLASLLLLGGSLGDLHGRRRIFSLSLAGFGATSLLCAFAPTDEILVVARALQGADGAMLVPSSLAIITTVFEPHERGRAIGLWTAWTGMAFVVGPLVGGALIDALSWRLIFAINVPFVIVTIAILARSCPETKARDRRPKVDRIGALLCTAGLAGPVFALIEQPAYGFANPVVWLPLVLGVIAFAAFVLHERRTHDPMVPLGLFRNRNFTGANLASLAIYGGLGAVMFFLVLFLQQVAGYSALGAGVALMPITLIMFALASRFGALADRIGPRIPMTAGPLVGGAGLMMLLGVDAAADYTTSVLPAVLVFGVGLAMTVAPLTATVLAAAPERRAGVASGLNNAVTRVGALLAIAAVGAAVSAQFSSALEDDLSAEALSADASAAVATAKLRPLTVAVDVPGLGSQESTEIEESTRGAAVRSFHLAIAISAGLVMLGGLLSAVWVRGPPRESKAPVGLPTGRPAPVSRAGTRS